MMIDANRVILIVVAFLLLTSKASAKTIYVHLIAGNDSTADGSYDRPFKSWRVALRHVTSGDTIIAKNGDYRKAGREGKWGGLDFTLTLADQLLLTSCWRFRRILNGLTPPFSPGYSSVTHPSEAVLTFLMYL